MGGAGEGRRGAKEDAVDVECEGELGFAFAFGLFRMGGRGRGLVGSAMRRMTPWYWYMADVCRYRRER